MKSIKDQKNASRDFVFFDRLLTDTEERKMEFVHMKARKIHPTDISKHINRANIPEHLKSIKKYKNGSYILLGKVGEPGLLKEGIEGGVEDSSIYESSNDDIITIMAPAFKPAALSQIEECRDSWPVIYAKYAEEKIDELMAGLIMKELRERSRSIPSPRFLTLSKGNSQAQLGLTDATAASCRNNMSFCSGGIIIADQSDILYCGFDSEPLFGHCILEAVECISRRRKSNCRNGNLDEFATQENEMNVEKLQDTNTTVSEGYLCTDLSAYLLNEPCQSCAMALVHGRIKRVFVEQRTASNDGVFSRDKFNYNANLNHRYNVYFMRNDK